MRPRKRSGSANRFEAARIGHLEQFVGRLAEARRDFVARILRHPSRERQRVLAGASFTC